MPSNLHCTSTLAFGARCKMHIPLAEMRWRGYALYQHMLISPSFPIFWGSLAPEWQRNVPMKTKHAA